MDWWPVAGGETWSWGWRAYPGVWLLIAAIGVGYALLVWRAGRGTSRPTSSDRIVVFGAGLAVLWLSLDWPLGTLAASYLAGANALQDLLITLVAAPLLLLGLPELRPQASVRNPSRLFEVLAWPLRSALPAAIVFAAVLAITYAPPVVDTLRPSAFGSFAITAVWFASAVVLWSPILGPLGGRRRLPYLGALFYLIAPFFFPKIVGGFLVFGDEPHYEVYADAPRVWADLSALTDQQVAGLILWVIGSVMVFGALAVLFFHWYAEDRRMTRPDSLEVPADPRAVDALFEVPGGWAALEGLVAAVEAALPDRHTGVELGFDFRERPGEDGPQVILEVHVALDGGDEARFAQAIEDHFSAVLRTIPRARRDSVAARLAFRVEGFGSRVG